MTRGEEIAWAAGLFEGEGCISLADNWGGRLHVILDLSSTDRDVVEKFAAIVKCGTFGGPYGPFGAKAYTHKPFWKWRASAKADVAQVKELLLPHLCERRRAKWLDCLERQANQRPKKKTGPPRGRYLKETCRRGHPFTEENTYVWQKDADSLVVRRCRTCDRDRKLGYKARARTL